jgi:hypothetical protein
LSEIQRIIKDPGFLQNLVDTFSKSEELVKSYATLASDCEVSDWLFVGPVAKEQVCVLSTFLILIQFYLPIMEIKGCFMILFQIDKISRSMSCR